MPELGVWTAMLYGAGVLIGLVRIDGPPAARIGLALLWPLGLIAFAATLAVLVAASLAAFPLFGAAVLAAAAAYSLLSV